MRDEYDSRLWAEHHQAFTDQIGRIWAEIRHSFERLAARRYDAPWATRIGPDCCR